LVIKVQLLFYRIIVIEKVNRVSNKKLAEHGSLLETMSEYVGCKLREKCLYIN